MSDPRVEQLLRDFLEAEAEQRAKGITLESLHRVFLVMANRVSNLEAVVGNVVTRLKATEHEVQRLSEAAPGPDWQPHHAEITGTFAVQELIRDKQRRDSDHKWLKRHRYAWLSDIGKLILAAVAGWLASKVGK